MLIKIIFQTNDQKNRYKNTLLVHFVTLLWKLNTFFHEEMEKLPKSAFVITYAGKSKTTDTQYLETTATRKKIKSTNTWSWLKLHKITVKTLNIPQHALIQIALAQKLTSNQINQNVPENWTEVEWKSPRLNKKTNSGS